MNTETAFQIALAVIGSVGGAGLIIVGLASWLGKVWANRVMQGDIAKHSQNIENLKSELKRLESEHSIRFSKLHDRRAEAISALYDYLYEFDVALQRLRFQYQGREIREDLDRQFELARRESWVLVPGIHTLSPDEQVQVEELSSRTKELHQHYGKNRLYLPRSCCDVMDNLIPLTTFVAVNYQNVALKDNDGNLLVNPAVKKFWDISIERIPLLLQDLEAAFRAALGESLSNEA